MGLSFNFLHADDVGLDFIHEGRKAILFEDGANSVDVPGGEGDGHAVRLENDPHTRADRLKAEGSHPIARSDLR